MRTMKKAAVTTGAGKPAPRAKGQVKKVAEGAAVAKRPSDGGVQVDGAPGQAPDASAGTVTGKDWQPRLRAKFVTDIAGGTRRAADLLEVAPSQTSRWVSGESVPGPVQARMLVDIDHVLAHALLVWADPGVARDWLTTANARLDGARPLDWIRVHGTAEVVEALRAEAAGAYA